MEQVKVKDHETGQVFNLELIYSVENKKDNPVFVSEHHNDHRLFSDVQPPQYQLLQGDMDEPYALDIHTNQLININHLR